MADSTTNQMPVTTQGMLDSVNSAIMAIAVGGQSYKIGSRSLTRADLKQLYQIKNDLTAQLHRDNDYRHGYSFSATPVWFRLVFLHLLCVLQ